LKPCPKEKEVISKQTKGTGRHILLELFFETKPIIKQKHNFSDTLVDIYLV